MNKVQEPPEQEFFAVLLVDDLEGGNNVYEEFDNKPEALAYYEEQKEMEYEAVLLVRILEETRQVVTREEYSYKDE